MRVLRALGGASPTLLLLLSLAASPFSVRIPGGVEVAEAHESRPGYLELREEGPGVYRMLWKRPTGGEVEINISPVLPEGCALQGTASSDVRAQGALVARAIWVCDGGLADKVIEIAGLETTITDVLVRIHYADGLQETHLVQPTQPSVSVGGPTGTLRRILAYLRLGVEHIALGVDHLLFVLGLLLIVSTPMMLFKTITAFTVAHSITLGIATLGHASAPALPLNAVIALSILFLGPEIVRVWRGETSFTIRHPWVVAFAFGLLHGFGFASGLTAMGLPSNEIPLALLFFNVGVELGQILFVLLVLGLVRSFRTLEIRWPRWATLAPGYAVGTLGAFWFIQRTLILLGLV